MDNLELLKRQFRQLLEPERLSLPSLEQIRIPHVQAYLYETMFREEGLEYPPPDRYGIRVLKMLIERMERAIIDPEEDVGFPNFLGLRFEHCIFDVLEISDDLAACLAQLMSRPQVPATTAALQKSFVTYTMPVTALNAATITTLEARALLASTGITGLRTWEAALYLGSYLSTTEGTLLVQNKRIIELGAGTGFVSILCAKHLGANYVLATDGSGEVVDDMVSNVYLNGHEGNGIIDTAVLEWGHTLVGRIFESHSDTRTFDVALGADVTFDERLILPLVLTLKRLYEKNPRMVCIVSATVRNERTLEAFEEACGSHNLQFELINFPSIQHNRQIGFFHSTNAPLRLYYITELASA
ncbi:hypothetical protein MMC15_003230 [Xylographa vitiligo]|nr:hypothetical protein [Xylographa vitiligo]